MGLTLVGFCLVAVVLTAWALAVRSGCFLPGPGQGYRARPGSSGERSLPAYLVPRFDGKPQVKVWLRTAPAKPSLSCAGPCSIRPQEGTTRPWRVKQQATVHAHLIKGGFQFGGRRLACASLDIVPEGDARIKVSGQDYYGTIRLINAGGKLAVVNIVDADQYVMGVVGGEMPTSWSVEALKAQAVAARTYALYFQQLRRQREWHVMNTTADQVYRGGRMPARVRRAIRETQGQVLMHRGGIFPAFYHSTCGGWTEPPGPALGRPQFDYLQGVPCDYCKPSRFFAWQAQITPARLAQKLKAEKISVGGPITSVVLVQSDETRPRTVRVTWRGGEKTVSMSAFRRAVGRKKMRNGRFVCAFHEGNFVFQGRGFGHGAGMCQYGARGMAQKGCTYDQILAHYYRNTVLRKAY